MRDITTGQPTPTLEENQMYDWDGQFDEMLGLPIQLRNRVSDPGTPQLGLPQELLDMVEEREEPLQILGVGPDYTRLLKIQEGTVRGKSRNCLPSEEKVGLFPHTTASTLKNPSC